MGSLSISLNRTTGYTKATNFSVSVNYTPLDDLIKIKWSFGDGAIIYDKTELDHYYAVPGEYDINLFAYTETDVLSAKKTVRVENYVKDSVYFNIIPPPAFAGHINRYPFRINITTASVGENIVDLYAQYSRSYPYQDPQNKWSFLKPQWRFLDLDGNQIWNIKTIDSPLKITADGIVDQINGTTVGVSGYAEFYFVDDIYNNDLAFDGENYTTLWATLQTSGRRVVSDSFNADLTLPGFANSTARAFAPYMVLKRFPEKLLITENGLRPHSNPRWTGSVQPVIIKAGFDDSFSDDWVDGNGILQYQPFAKYIPLEQPDIYFDAGVINLSTNFVPQPCFKWIDDTTFKVAGYYKGSFYVDPNTPYAFSTNITAAANINTGSTISSYFNPHIWLPNPNAGTVSVAQYYKNNNSDFGQIDTTNLQNAQVKTFEMPVIDTVDFEKDPMALSGFHGIYSVASLPAPNYHAWLCDSEMNTIYRVSTVGQILCSIDLNEVVKKYNLGYDIENVLSPSYISLDGERNIWVSLYDTISVLKFNPIGDFLFATTPIKIKESVPTGVYDWFIQNSYYPTTVNNYDHRLVEPTCIETDKDNNLWVSYSNYLSGFVTKIDKNGNLLFSTSSPVCSTPQEIISDKDGNVWICNNGNVWGTFGSIQKRSSTGTLLSTFKGIQSPNYLTLDVSQNLWFSYGYNKIGYINNINGNTLTYTISGTTLCLADNPYADYPKSNIAFSNKYPSKTPWFNESQNVDETAIEGIACDMRGYLYIINSIENMVYVFDSIEKKKIDNFYISPQGFLFFQADQLKPTKMEYCEWNKSLQATGDWTGSRWINKYAEKYLPYFTTTSKSFYITGISDKLNFYDRSVYTAFKINEDFNLAESMKQFAHMPILQKSEFFFDEFLGNIFGKEPFYQDDLAVTAYEKIANFVNNTSDPETCEIPQLYDLAQMINSESEDLQLNYPPTIKRVMSFASINLSKLLGTECNCGMSFERHNDCAKVDICPYCKKEKKNNRGNLIDTLTYTVTAGNPLVLKTKSINNYRLIPTGIVDDKTKYTVNVLATSIGLGNDWTQYYEFYEYIPYWNGGIIENLIDWNSDQTTISRNLSTNDDWYKDEGLLDIFFNYELYKGLGLLDD